MTIKSVYTLRPDQIGALIFYGFCQGFTYSTYNNNGETVNNESSTNVMQELWNAYDQHLAEAGMAPDDIISLADDMNYEYCPKVDIGMSFLPRESLN